MRTGWWRAGSDTLRAAYITGAFTLAAALAGGGGDAATLSAPAEVPRPSGVSAPANEPTEGCPDFLRQQNAMVDADPGMVAVLLEPGDDGVSPMDADPRYAVCGLDETSVRLMARS